MAGGYLNRPAARDSEKSYYAFLRLSDFRSIAAIGVAERHVHEIECITRESQCFCRAYKSLVKGGRFCVRGEGYTCLVPAKSLKGDGVCVFPGGAVPSVIREMDSGFYMLVEKCYLHRLMDGKALEMVLDVDTEAQWSPHGLEPRDPQTNSLTVCPKASRWVGGLLYFYYS